MASYQQRRVEYEVREFNHGGGAQSWNTDCGGFQKAGGYGNASGFSAGGGASYVGGGASYGGGGASYGGGAGGSYGGGYSSGGSGYGAAGGGYSSGFGGATEYSSGVAGAGAGGYECYNTSGSAGGYGQAQMYKNEVHTMPAKSGVYGASEMGVGDAFCALVPSSFPPGTDPKFIDCFNRIDKDRSGLICDQELMAALSNFDQRFSLRTVHLLMYMFTGSNSKVVGPKEFVPLVRSLQTWKAIFQKYDFDRNGRLDERELKDALMSMGFTVSPFVLKLVMSKYDKSGYKCAIEYDYFIECCVVVKGLTEKFRAKEDGRGCGAASFTYDEFLLSVLPFIVA
ncbi:uncharacterized protein [Phyllobates terribilis]|uniref:uncharacterized protein n=1 Tax=Phyllobates terribilis TaxID=111132 RepID=UPI003CCAD031